MMQTDNNRNLPKKVTGNYTCITLLIRKAMAYYGPYPRDYRCISKRMLKAIASKSHPIDSHNHSKVLVRRVENEFQRGNLEDALSLGDTFLWLYSSHTLQATKLASKYLKYGSRHYQIQDFEAARQCYQKALDLTFHITKSLDKTASPPPNRCP